MRNFWLAAAAACLVSTGAEARTWPAAGGWDIVQGDDSCAITSEFQGPGDTELYLILNLDGSAILAVSNSQWSIQDKQELELSYHLNGTSYSGGKAVGITQSYIKKGFVTRFGPEFVADFIKSTYLHIYKGETVVDKLDLAGSGAGIAQARRCLSHVKALADAAAREKARWAHIPKDPFAGDPVKVGEAKAKGNPGTWVTNADYPAAAVQAKESGTTGFSLDIGTDGRVTNCTVTSSSGSALLDTTTCTLLTRRARFTPARDNKGNPAPDTFSSRFRWTLPEE